MPRLRLRHPAPLRPAVERLESRDTPATFSVTTLASDDAATPGTFRYELDQANTTPGADAITFAPGLTGTLQAKATYQITESVTIQGPAGGGVTINGLPAPSGGPAQSALFTNTGAATALSDLTIQNHAGTDDVGGGGIVNSGGLTLTNVVIRNTSAAINGGAVRNTGTLLVLNSQFLNDTAGFGGGAISSFGKGLTVTDTLIQGNQATGGSGGGVNVSDPAAAFTRVRFLNNQAFGDGGGLDVSDQGVNATVTDSTFDGNAAGALGGAGAGGGLVASAGATVAVTGSAVTNNSSIDGGGIFFGLEAPVGGGTYTLVNDTVAGNTSSGSAGGVGVGAFPSGVSSTVTVSVTNTTITGNTAQGGGAGGLDASTDVGVPAAVFLGNSLVALNTGANSNDIAGFFNSTGGNLFGDTTGAIFSPGPGDVTDPNPVLGPLGNYGGLTQTVPLLVGSPALGIGQTGGSTPVTDQRGLPRPAGGPIDAGAYQVQAPIGLPDFYTAAAGTALTVPAPGVLGNDGTTEPEPLTATLAAGVAAAAGTLTLNADGSFTFTPAAGFSGTAAFTYVPSNGIRDGAAVMVTITVLPAPPVSPPPPPVVALLAVGAGAGGGPRVRVYDLNGNLKQDFFAFEPSFMGGVRVAAGDVNGDGTDDIVAAAGPGGGPRVKVFDGKTGAILFDFMAYESSFLGGVNVAVADINGDGRADIITGAGSLGGPLVKVFDGRTGALIESFFAYDENFRGGVRVAAGDVNGDGTPDIVTAPGVSGGPRVKVYDGKTLAVLADYFAADPGYRGGLYVAVVPSVGGAAGSVAVGLDGVPEFEGSLLQSLYPGLFDIGGTMLLPNPPAAGSLTAAPLVGVFRYDPAVTGGVDTPLTTTAYAAAYTGGVRVGVVDATGQGGYRLVTAPGPLGGSLVKIFALTTGLPEVKEFQAFESDFNGSVYVS